MAIRAVTEAVAAMLGWMSVPVLASDPLDLQQLDSQLSERLTPLVGSPRRADPLPDAARLRAGRPNRMRSIEIGARRRTREQDVDHHRSDGHQNEPSPDDRKEPGGIGAQRRIDESLHIDPR